MKKAIHMIDIRSKSAGVMLPELKKAEKELGALFPDEYKELFLDTDGAKFGDWTLYPIRTNEQPLLSNDIVRQNRENRPENVPGEMVCIGEKVNGDQLCYRIRKRFMQEQIYVWNPKTGKSDCKALTLSKFIEWNVPRVNTNKPKKVGAFTVKSGKLIVSDPYYPVDQEEDTQLILPKVKSGNWTASINYNDEEAVVSLRALYGEKKPTGKWHDCGNLIAVDSGQAGIFDLSIYGKDEAIQYEVKNVDDIEIDEAGTKYFVACCDMVASDAQGGVVPGGVVSMSGYGDGMYAVRVKYNVLKEIIGVMIDFSGD